MKYTVNPTFISGTVHIPPSKSYMQRACAAALIKGGRSVIKNYGYSNDDKAALDVVQQLGATIITDKDGIVINSNFREQSVEKKNTEKVLLLHLGESGLGLRMFTPIAALLQQSISITGQGSLLKRPNHFFDEIFPLLQVAIQSNLGFLPFTIKGPLHPSDITIDGSLSSQFLTGLLMAYSAANSNATITVKNLTSKPYIDITLDILKCFGLQVPVHDNYKTFIFTKKEQAPAETIQYTIEGDWSSASFMLVGGAINGAVHCTGLQLQSVQSDKKILDALQLANATMTIEKDKISVSKSNLKGFTFDATDCPDLFPPLVALAANANGSTKIKGLKRLLYKESNRGLTLQQEFAKLDIPIDLNEDEMTITGKGQCNIINPNCNSHEDHRIVMALAVAVLNSKNAIHIENAEAVNKSYPEFFEALAALQK